MPRLKSILLVAMIGFSGPALAQSDAPTQDTDPVLVFNRVCYAQVPVLDNIREISARLAWEPMGGDDLRQFTTVDNPDILEGWDVRIAQRLYRLGIVQTPVTGGFLTSFPDFSEGKATSCSLVLDGRDEADVIARRMTTLAGKEPVRENVAEGNQFTTTWAGGNDDFKVFLFQKSDSNGKAGLLNVTILSKEKL